MQVSPTPRPGDEHAEKRKPLRAGYVGHLTQVSNRLLQLAADGHEQVRGAGAVTWRSRLVCDNHGQLPL